MPQGGRIIYHEQEEFPHIVPHALYDPRCHLDCHIWRTSTTKEEPAEVMEELPLKLSPPTGQLRVKYVTLLAMNKN